MWGHPADCRFIPFAACNYEASVARSDTVNAYADDDEMFVTTGMMNFVKSDQELALVLGHELSHNFLGHLDAQFRNRILGAGAGLLVDALVIATNGVNPGLYRTGANAGAQLFSVAFEQEARPCRPLCHAARGAHDIEGVADFWRRMGARQFPSDCHRHRPPAERRTLRRT